MPKAVDSASFFAFIQRLLAQDLVRGAAPDEGRVDGIGISSGPLIALELVLGGMCFRQDGESQKHHRSFAYWLVAWAGNEDLGRSYR